MNTTQNVRLTHFSLIGFDGESQLWKNWDNFPFLTMARCPKSGGHYPGVFKGSMWHVSLNHHHFSEDSRMKPDALIVGEIKLGEMVALEYGKVRYLGRINFGFDRSVVAVSILGIEGSEMSSRIFTNSIKVYTNLLTTKNFLDSSEPLLEIKIDERKRESKHSGPYYPHFYGE